MSPFPNRFNPPQSGRKYEQDEIGIRLAPRCFGDDVARNGMLGVGDSNGKILGNRGVEKREIEDLRTGKKTTENKEKGKWKIRG